MNNLIKKIDIRGLIIRILIFFMVLTGLNIVIFSIMAFINQSSLILDYAIANSHKKGTDIYNRVTQKLETNKLLTDENWIVIKKVLEKNYAVTPEDLNKIKTKLQSRKLTDEHFESIQEILLREGYGISKFKIFDQQANLLYSYGLEEKERETTPLEKKRIVQSIFASDYQNKAFYNDNVRDYKYVDIYIPISYDLSRSIILKPTIEEEKISENLTNFFRQSAFAGLFMLVAHIAFITIAYNIIVKPLRKANTTLEEQNAELERQRNELKEMNDMLTEELDMAQKLQQAILLRDKPEVDTISLGHIYIGMNRVSGDYIDTIPVDDDLIGLLIVDVSGHGVPSALITTMAKVSFNSHSDPKKSTAEICSEVNLDLYNTIAESDYYLTAFYAILNIKTNELTYTNAGHCSPIIYRYETNELEEITTQGFFIGSFDFAQFESKTTKLNEGDKLLLFTDGIIEAVNEKDEIYDYPRLNDFILKNAKLKATDFSQELLQDVNKYVGDAPASDDISLIVLEINQNNK